MNKLILVLFFLIAAITQSCIFKSADSKLAEDFFHDISPLDWEKSMERYSLEDQYKIYIYGMQVIHPPLLELSKPFAKQGQKVIPFLISKLESTDDDAEVSDIVNIIQEMARLKTYNAKQDVKLIEAINISILRMKDSYWKRITSNDLKQIQRP